MWGYGPGWGMMGDGWGWGGYALVHMVVWLVIVALAIAAVVWLLRNGMGRVEAPQPTPRRRPGLDILEERYARGEINRDEYLQKRQDILDR